MTSRVLAVSEAEWMVAVADRLDFYGWTWHDTWPTHRTPGRWTPEHAAKGVPDLICLRPPRVLWLEIKTETGRVSLHQEAWIKGLRQSGQEAYIVHIPRQLQWLDDLLSPDAEQLTLTTSTGYTGVATWTPESVRE
jgi:hypothetical protein